MAAMACLGRGGGHMAATAAATAAGREAEDGLEASGSGRVELDEYGRNRNLGQQREAQARRWARCLGAGEGGAWVCRVGCVGLGVLGVLGWVCWGVGCGGDG
jgi:hypothetical protein